MSSLTTLGINKNKKGFAPKIAKRKPKANPSVAVAVSTTSTTAAAEVPPTVAVAPSIALATENDTIDESITSNCTIDESARSPYVSKQSPYHPRDDFDEELNELGLTQEEVEMNALVSQKRRQSTSAPEGSSASAKRKPSGVSSPMYVPAPITAPSPKAPIIDRPDCAFSGRSAPVLKMERITPGPNNSRKSMSRPLKEDEEDPVDAKERLAAAPVSSVPSSPFTQDTTAPARSPAPERSPSPPPAPRSRKNKGKQRATEEAADESSPPPQPQREGRGRQRVVEVEEEEYEFERSPSPAPAPAPTKRNKGKQRTTSDDEDYGKRPKRTAKKPSVNKRATKSSRTAAGSSIGIPSVSSSSGVAISIGAPSKQKSDDEDSDNDSDNRRPRFNGRKVPKKYAYRLPENLKTLDDITNDPTKLENLDKSMATFTKDIDGIVSKNFKELEINRYNAKKKLEDAKNMSEEELAVLKKKEEEEQELLAKKKQIAKEKEEERRRKEKDGQILAESSNALQVRLINGQIVLDTDSLTVERRGADQDYGDGAMEVVEENAMSRRVNSQTYSKRKQSARWDEVETAQFYDCISQFGTDFEMISMVMPGRTRAQIRLKFNREEKINPAKITEHLIRKRKPVDLAKYEEIAGVELETVPEDFHEMQLA